MIATMAKEPKKKPKTKAEPRDSIPEEGAYQFPLRFADARLARLVADRAERMRRSVNQQILFTLEEIERNEGFWPPKE
jgi:hypothetical protein